MNSWFLYSDWKKSVEGQLQKCKDLLKCNTTDLLSVLVLLNVFCVTTDMLSVLVLLSVYLLSVYLFSVLDGSIQKCEDLLKSNTTDVLSVLDGLTALHRAAQSGNGDVCSLLVNQGIPINAVAHDGRTPLHFAVDCRDTNVFKRLLKLGADLTIQDNEGLTPMDYCLNEDWKEAFEEKCNDIQELKDAEKLICELKQHITALNTVPDGQSLFLVLANAFGK